VACFNGGGGGGGDMVEGGGGGGGGDDVNHSPSPDVDIKMSGSIPTPSSMVSLCKKKGLIFLCSYRFRRVRKIPKSRY